MCCRQQGYCTARTTSLHSLMHDPMSCAQQRGAQAVSGWRTCSRVIRAYAWAVGGGLPARWRTEHAGVGEEGLGGARVGCRRQRPRPLQGASPSGGSGTAHGARRPVCARAQHMRILSRRQALCALVPRSHMFRHPRRRVVDAGQAMRPSGPLGEACPCPARVIRQAPPGAPMLFHPPFNT